MIPRPEQLSAPTRETPAELLTWRPEHGVLSLYLRIDPGDRAEGWRTELRNGLSAVLGAADGEDHARRSALRETASRLGSELEEERKGERRGLIGFVEVASNGGEERWFATQIPPRRTEVLRGAVAQIHPLLELLDDGASLGVVAISSERVRLLDWRLGRIEELHDWELEYFGEDWRERKAPRPPDPARGEAVSASGRDQHDQRLDATRERFVEQTGGLAQSEAGKRPWRQMIVFGEERYARKFAAGFGDRPGLINAGALDLVVEPIARIEQRVERMLPELNRARETSLIDRIKELAYTEGRSALGVQETLQALGEGRVEHLVYDAGREYVDVPAVLGDDAGPDGVSVSERMVELALATGAAVTPVEGESAAALEEQGGVAALLRY